MAQVKIEDIIEHLDHGVRRALEETIKYHFPNQDFDSRQVFRTFKRMISRKCSIWENIPDRLIRREE
jgi:hypothetical protein